MSSNISSFLSTTLLFSLCAFCVPKKLRKRRFLVGVVRLQNTPQKLCWTTTGSKRNNNNNTNNGVATRTRFFLGWSSWSSFCSRGFGRRRREGERRRYQGSDICRATPPLVQRNGESVPDIAAGPIEKGQRRGDRPFEDRYPHPTTTLRQKNEKLWRYGCVGGYVSE